MDIRRNCRRHHNQLPTHPTSTNPKLQFSNSLRLPFRSQNERKDLRTGHTRKKTRESTKRLARTTNRNQRSISVVVDVERAWTNATRMLRHLQRWFQSDLLDALLLPFAGIIIRRAFARPDLDDDPYRDSNGGAPYCWPCYAWGSGEAAVAMVEFRYLFLGTQWWNIYIYFFVLKNQQDDCLKNRDVQALRCFSPSGSPNPTFISWCQVQHSTSTYKFFQWKYYNQGIHRYCTVFST